MGKGDQSYASLVFTGSGGATYTKALWANVDVRDYNNSGVWASHINGTTTTNVFTTKPDIWGALGVLDMQHIVLPAAFANQTLTQIQLIDNGSPNFQRVVLDGVTLSSVPEPSTLLLWSGLGALGLVMAWRRRKPA